MQSRKNAIDKPQSTWSSLLTSWSSNKKSEENNEVVSRYPARPNRYFPFGWNYNHQDCYTKEDEILLQRIQDEYNQLVEKNEDNYFNKVEEKHWYDWWRCVTPAYSNMMRKYDTESFTLPNREAKDTKAFPLWDLADNMARQIANWQAERVKNQKIDLMNDPVMLIFEELRDWFFNILSSKQCKQEDLAYIAKRQSYVKNLIHLIPNFGNDRLYLQEIHHALDGASKIMLNCIANKELPQLLSDTIISTKGLENTIGTYLHFLLVNDEVADNFSPEYLEGSKRHCSSSPLCKIYHSAELASNANQVDAALTRFQDLNKLYKLEKIDENNGIIKVLASLQHQTASSVNFASFIEEKDKENYIESLAVLNALTNVRMVLENFRNVQTSIGTYVFAINYLDEANKLATNYINLVSRAKQLVANLIHTADKGLKKILSDPNQFQEKNKLFENNLRMLETKVVKGTTLTNQLEDYSRKAIVNMNNYKNEMDRLVSDINSGAASREVETAMRELFEQINELNTMMPAILDDKILMIEDNNVCLAQDNLIDSVENKKIDSYVREKEIPKKETTISKKTSSDNKVISSAIEASWFGALRGGADILEYKLKTSGYTENYAYYLSQLAYYSSYFSSKYYIHYQENADGINAMYQAAFDTGQACLVSMGFNVIGKGFHYVGNQLEQYQWKRLGNGVKKLGNLVKFGVFAQHAYDTGVAEMSAAIVAGVATETLVAIPGKYLVKRFS
ncbi:MAG: hypothetical protein ACD_46C00218G0002 [uncultured bacterium]|nr:MAG: hypothetical protein ACD_46C00218G0002 [uncultured bacterium]